MKHVSILVVGSVNMDIVTAVPRFPVKGQTLIGRSFSQNPGGKGANCAVAAARMGAGVTFAGCVGTDAHGPMLRAVLQKEGIDTRFLMTTDRQKSGFADIWVNDEGDNCIIVVPGANERIPLPALNEAFAAKEYDVLVMQLEINHDAIFAAAETAARMGIPVVLDAGPAQDFPIERIPNLIILSPNETEAEALTGLPAGTEEEALRAAKALKARANPQWVVIKMGSRGAFVYGEGLSRLIPSFPVTSVDPTAAGDTFTAAMTVRYLQTGDIEAAVRYGCAAGAIACQRMGAMPSLPTGEETEAFLRGRMG